MSWYKIELTLGEIANGNLFVIQDDFKKIFLTLKAPKDMAMFAAKTLYANYVYFSSGCTETVQVLITKYKAQSCEPPLKDEVALLVGHANAWDLLPK